MPATMSAGNWRAGVISDQLQGRNEHFQEKRQKEQKRKRIASVKQHQDVKTKNFMN